MSQTSTDVPNFIGDLNAGIFEKQLGAVLSDVAAGVVLNGKQGEVTIKLKLKQISDTSQVKSVLNIRLTIKPRPQKADTEPNIQLVQHLCTYYVAV